MVVLGDGATRFTELKRSMLGISQRMLTVTLRGLERDGLVTRTVYPTVPPSVEYALTLLGRTLREPVALLAVWAQGHRRAVQRARDAYDEGAQKKPRA